MTIPVNLTCPEINASFTSTPQDGYAPLTVDFDDTTAASCGHNIDRREWDFGDVNSSAGNPRTSTTDPASHTFYDPGIYQVNLTTWNDCGNSDNSTQLITVRCPPVTAEFTPSPNSGDAPLPVNFDDASRSNRTIIGRNWTFGDGNVSIGNNILTHNLYSNPGTYRVNLTATNDCGNNNTISRDVVVTCPSPIADFITNPTPPEGRSPLTVSFTDNSSGYNITGYNWTFGNGNVSQWRDPPPQTYRTVGLFPANLTVRNWCGNENTITKWVNVTCEEVHASYTANRISGLTFEFNDTSSGGTITEWRWNFGDGNITQGSTPVSYYKQPIHTFVHPGTYQVNLTVWNDCGNSDSYVSDVTAICEPMYADFSWDMPADTDPYKVQFHSPLQNCGNEDCEYDILDWEWDFEDGTANVTGTREPFHTFPDGYNPEGKFVTLTVKNHVDPVCNNEASIRKQITFNCPPLYASFTTNKSSGPPGSVIAFTDTSRPQADIMRWRWIFGDTSPPWESTDPLNHNPPPHKYSDPVPRIYTAVLQIFNSCGQSYSSSQIISVTSPASISGHLWEDNNVNGIEDSGEPPLQNWRVNLEKRDGTNWVFQQSTLTNAAGNYLFNIDVATAVFRVTIDYPTGQTWKTTYSYRSNAEKASGLLSIGADRTITGVNFGNARWKTSSLIIPGYMARYNKAGNLIDNWYYSGLTDSAEFFEFTTSRDPTVRAIYMSPRNSNSGTFTIPSYSAWGNSSFTIYPREYNTYLKTTYGGESGAFYLRYWRYNGVDYFGIPFTVPDNTAIAASQLILKYYWDPVIYFKFDKPLEGEIIPYTNSYRVEVHFQGPHEDTSNCYLTTPVSTQQRLTYDSTIGEYARDIDVRSWEGTTRLFTARMKLTNGSNSYAYTYVTATIGWDPITTAITNVQSEATAPQIKGLTTVTGTVTGKWRDNANVTLIVNEKETYPMTLVSQSGTTSTLRTQFDPEPYAGKTISLKIRAYPQTGHGDMAESAIYSATVVSKLPLIANFTADPWTGPVPLWISFTDTSQGGPNWWSWNFNDGNTSNVQNPIKSYVTPGNYSVTLQVRNITGVTRTVSKWVNLTGSWHKTEINSDRYSYLKSGGELWWIATVDDSSITVNNTAYPVMNDDRVKLVLRSDINNTMNNRIELGGGITTCNLSNVSLFLNGAHIDNGAITAINMPDFQNFHTNLQLVALKNSTKFAMIKWDADDWRTISKTRDLNVYDLMPDWNKTMTLYLSDGFTTFDGWASDYSPK
ncbi:PKD domain-containing protein [Methanospirillum sp.]|uniref:PKD domain-containing protein n=1 Tax=Methanospirillum sp. TaxID=45200 RepID=UPI001BD20CF9